MNILPPDSGDIRILGGRLTNSITDRVGYMPEERGLYTRMKVKDILKFYAELKGYPLQKQELMQWLEKLDLADWANKKLEALSKGMAQKVQFITTVIARPELIILDEPFSGLDPVNSEVIRDTILELQKQGTTVIFSTHDMNVAEKMCDYILMIYKGRKVLDDTLTKIQDQYGSDTIRIKTENQPDGLFDRIAGIEKVNDFGRIQELRMKSECNHQEILAEIMNRATVTRFDVVKPSLHDIFIRIAKPADREVLNA